MPKDNIGFKQKPIRTLLLSVILTLAVVIFLVSSFDIVTKERKLPSHTSVINDRGLRGKIISRDGYTLSRSTKTYTATVYTQSIDPNKIDLFTKLFSIYSGIDEKKIKKLLNKRHGYTVLSKTLDAGTAIHLKSLAYKFRRMRVFRFTKNSKGADVMLGLDIIENGEKRVFPLGDTLSPVLGYIQNKDDGRYTEVKGMKGLERKYEKYLNSSKNGYLIGKRDVAGTIIRNKSSKRKVRYDGLDIHLNIELKLQQRIEVALDGMQAITGAKEIIAGVMESKTGKIIALASSERFNPSNIKTKDVYSLNPKFSEYLYEPGSVIKPITLSVALDLGRVTPNTWLDTKGGRLRISSRYTISDDEVFDSLTATDVIVHSSNVGISKIAWKLSGEELYDGMRRFGLAKPTGIDLSRELAGKIKSAKQLRNRLNRANQSYGYGMTASFVELWRAYNSFNNDGMSVTPRIVSYLEDSKGKTYNIKSSRVETQMISKSTAEKMRKILKKVVTDGTGKAAIYLGLEIGGKTGTAHIVKNRRYIDQYNSSFYGFANDSNGSKYTIGVLAMELHKNHKHFASQSAVPTFRKIVDSMVELDYLKPDFSVIEKEKMKMREKKRQIEAKKKQRARTEKIKAKLKQDRRKIRQRQKEQKQKIQRQKEGSMVDRYEHPVRKHKNRHFSRPDDTTPDMF